jgi:hypothetical protein
MALQAGAEGHGWQGHHDASIFASTAAPKTAAAVEPAASQALFGKSSAAPAKEKGAHALAQQAAADDATDDAATAAGTAAEHAPESAEATAPDALGSESGVEVGLGGRGRKHRRGSKAAARHSAAGSLGAGDIPPEQPAEKSGFPTEKTLGAGAALSSEKASIGAALPTSEKAGATAAESTIAGDKAAKTGTIVIGDAKEKDAGAGTGALSAAESAKAAEQVALGVGSAKAAMGVQTTGAGGTAGGAGAIGAASKPGAAAEGAATTKEGTKGAGAGPEGAAGAATEAHQPSAAAHKAEAPLAEDLHAKPHAGESKVPHAPAAATEKEQHARIQAGPSASTEGDAGGGHAAPPVAATGSTPAPAPVAGQQPQVPQTPEMPKRDVASSQAGMNAPHQPFLPAHQQGGAGGGAGGGGAGGSDSKAGGGKSEAQLQAEAQQVAAAAKAKLATAEQGLQAKANTEADGKKQAAETERSAKEQSERKQGEAKTHAEQERGEAKKQQAQTQGEAKKQQAQAQAKTQEGGAKSEGEAKKRQAEQQREAEVAKNKQQETQGKAQLAAEKSQQEAQEKARSQAEQAQTKAKGEQDKAQTKAKGEQDKAQTKAKGEQDKARTQQQGQQKAEQERHKGKQQASEREAQGQRDAAAKKAEGQAEKARLEREAEAKKHEDSGGVIGWIADQVSSAFHSLMDAAKSAWNACVSAAQGILNAAKEAAKALVRAAENLAKAALDAMQKAVGDILQRVADAVSRIAQSVIQAVGSIVQRVADAIRAAVSALSQAIAAIAQRIAAAVTALVNRIASAIQAAIAACRNLLDAAVQWVKKRLTEIAQALRGLIEAAVAWVKSTIESIVNAIKSAIETIASAVKAAVEAAYHWAAEKIQQATKWLGEQLEKFGKWAQEAFVKFWSGPWRDILIGIAVAVVVGALVATTGPAGILLGAALSAAVTGAVRGTGEIVARRCAVAIKNDPERAARFEEEMKHGSGAEWYEGVDKNETWGGTLTHSAYEAGRGAVEGFVSGLAGGVGGAAGGKIGAWVASKGMGTVATVGTELLARTGVDFAINTVGTGATTLIVSAIDASERGISYEEALKKRAQAAGYIDEHGNMSMRWARDQAISSLGSSVTQLGGRAPATPGGAATPSYKDRVLDSMFGASENPTVRNRVMREVTDGTMQGTVNAVSEGTKSSLNGDSFWDGAARGFTGGFGNHVASKTGEGIRNSRQSHNPQGATTPAAEEAARTTPPTQEQPAATPHPVTTEQPAATPHPVTTEQPAATAHPVTTEQPAATAHPVAAAAPPAEVAPVALAHPVLTEAAATPAPAHQEAAPQPASHATEPPAAHPQAQHSETVEAAHTKFQATAQDGRQVIVGSDGLGASSHGPDGHALLTLREDGTVHREYTHQPKDEGQALARTALVMEESRAVVTQRDAQVKQVVDKRFAESGLQTADGRPAILIDKVILGAGGSAVQDYATHNPAQRAAVDDHGVPKILSLASGGDPWQMRHELMGQTPHELSGPNGLTSQPEMYAAPGAPYARSSDYATAVADTRAKSGMSVYESRIVGVVADETHPGAKYRVDIEVPQRLPSGEIALNADGHPVMERRAVYAGDVDVAAGPGPDRKLAGSRGTEVTPQQEQQLHKQGILSYGDAAVGQQFKEGERVLVSGGGATAAWGAERADKAQSQVDWVGGSGQVKPELDAVRTRIAAQQEAVSALPAGHPGRAEAEAQLRTMQQERDQLLRQGVDGRDGPFKGADLARNRETMENPRINRDGKSIQRLEGPLTEGPDKGKVLVHFDDGSTGIYDRIIVSHGQDATAPGGVQHMLSHHVDENGVVVKGGVLAEQALTPITAEHTPDQHGNPRQQILGLQAGEADSGGQLRILGAAATPRELQEKMLQSDREQTAALLNQRRFDENISAHSQGVTPGLEIWNPTYALLNGGTGSESGPRLPPAPTGPTAPPTVSTPTVAAKPAWMDAGQGLSNAPTPAPATLDTQAGPLPWAGQKPGNVPPEASTQALPVEQATIPAASLSQGLQQGSAPLLLGSGPQAPVPWTGALAPSPQVVQGMLGTGVTLTSESAGTQALNQRLDPLPWAGSKPANEEPSEATR